MVIMKCPHCESKAVAKSKTLISPLIEEIIFRCDDDYCGHSFVARLEIVKTTRPPKNGGRDLDIPTSNRSKYARTERQHGQTEAKDVT